MSTFFGFAFLFGAAGYAVHMVRKHLRQVAEAQAPCQHRPVVVLDGEVDLCRFCGALTNR